MPKQITSEELCSVIGEELFQKCSEKFKGKQFYFGKKSNPLKFKNNNQRDEFIYNACLKSGFSYAAVAEIVQLTPGYVQKIFYKKVKCKNNLS